jgi:hypothetical protein
MSFGRHSPTFRKNVAPLLSRSISLTLLGGIILTRTIDVLAEITVPSQLSGDWTRAAAVTDRRLRAWGTSAGAQSLRTGWLCAEDCSMQFFQRQECNTKCLFNTAVSNQRRKPEINYDVRRFVQFACSRFKLWFCHYTNTYMAKDAQSN